MTNKFLASVSLSLALCGFVTRAQGAVGIESEVLAPSFLGLHWLDTVSGEPDFNERARALAFEMDPSALDAILLAAKLPLSQTREQKDGHTYESLLQRVCFFELSNFCLQRDVRTGSYRGASDLYTLYRDFYRGGPQRLYPIATYARFNDGRSTADNYLTGKAIENVPVVIGKLSNHPYALTIPLSEVTLFQHVVRDTLERPEVGAVYERIKRYCSFPVNHRPGFETFLCDHYTSPAFTQNLKLRFQFLDQNEVARDFVFEHKPAIYSCHFFMNERPECFQSGDTPAQWAAWLNDDSATAAHNLIEAQGKLAGSVTFDYLSEAIQRAATAQPNLEVVMANAVQMELK